MVSTNSETKHWVKAVLLCTLLCGVQTAMAAGGLSGIEGGLKDFFKSFYGIVAILVGFGLLGCGLMGAMGVKQWAEIVPVAGWVVFCGAVPTLIKLLWDWGTSAL